MGKKILIFTPTNRPVGGVETMNRLLVETLATRGHEVDIIAFDELVSSRLVSFVAQKIGRALLGGYLVGRRAEQYDVAIANGEYAFGLRHPRKIQIMHGSAAGYLDAVRDHLPIRTRAALRRDALLQRRGAQGAYVVCVSDFLADVLAKQGIRADSVIDNCVDTTVFRPLGLERTDRCLYVGPANYYAKGIDILEKVAALGVPVDCVSSVRPSLLLGYVGAYDNLALPAVYGRYKVLLHPSRFEGLELVALEAMSCGTPVIVCKSGLGYTLSQTMPEFVVQTDDPAEYAERYKLICGRYSYYSEMARDYVLRNHDTSSFSKRWSAVVERVCSH